jgi:hypothetical protein
MKKTIFKTAAILLILVGMISSCGKEKESDENPYRENIIGKWKLVEIVTTIGYGNQNTDTVDYSNSNIIYDFQNDSIFIITGYVPDDLLEGMHTYNYAQPVYYKFGTPAPNLYIDYYEPVFCLPLKKEKKMSFSMETIPVLHRLKQTAELNDATRIAKTKTFIKLD